MIKSISGYNLSRTTEEVNNYLEEHKNAYLQFFDAEYKESGKSILYIFIINEYMKNEDGRYEEDITNGIIYKEWLK